MGNYCQQLLQDLAAAQSLLVQCLKDDPNYCVEDAIREEKKRIQAGSQLENLVVAYKPRPKISVI
jgi:hypothetical protein